MISLKSNVTKKLLNYFFMNPEESLYINEISRKFSLDKRNLVKKIKEFEKEGILISQARGNLKLYSINRKYPLYNEYRKIFMKTLGFEENLRKILSKTKDVKEAVIYGSYAKDNMDVHSDIDLLVVGDHVILSFQKNINRLQREINRAINVVNMGVEEFNKRKTKRDPFIIGIFKERHIRITNEI